LRLSLYRDFQLHFVPALKTFALLQYFLHSFENILPILHEGVRWYPSVCIGVLVFTNKAFTISEGFVFVLPKNQNE
jgi:hypothetical protein